MVMASGLILSLPVGSRLAVNPLIISRLIMSMLIISRLMVSIRMGSILTMSMPIPTVCPSKDFANILSYQSLPTSIQLWRGHGQEAKRGEVGGPRITRNVK